MGKARRDGRWINILLALLLLAGAAMTIHEGVAALQTSAALRRGAVETRGVVLEKYRSATGDTSDTFSIRYGYEADGGTPTKAQRASPPRMHSAPCGWATRLTYIMPPTRRKAASLSHCPAVETHCAARSASSRRRFCLPWPVSAGRRP